MENAGKPSGGRLEWSPLLFLFVPVLCASVFFFFCFFLFLSHFVLGHPFQLVHLLGCSRYLILISCSIEGLSGCV